MKMNRINYDKTSESIYKYYKSLNRNTAYNLDRVYSKDHNSIIKNNEQLVDKNKPKVDTNTGMGNINTPEASKPIPTQVKPESVPSTTAKADKETVSGLEPFSALEKLYTISTKVKKHEK